MSKTKQQRAADRWERLIRRECEKLRAFGVGVDKNWEAPKVPGANVPREASKPDFSGHLSNGHHVVFEAKVAEETTRFDFDQLTDGQREQLDFADAHKAVAFIYVLDGAGHRWVIPWALVVFCEEEGRSSFPFAEHTEQYRQRGEWNRTGASFTWSGESWLDTLERVGEVA